MFYPKPFPNTLAILLFLLIPFHSWGLEPSRIEGKVMEQGSEKAIPFASLVLKKGKKQLEGTAADAKGHYSFEDLPAATYRITASGTGFKKKTVTVHVGKEETVEKDIHLKPGNIDTVKIVAHKEPLVKKASGVEAERSRKTASKETRMKGEAKAKAGELTAGEINDLSEWEPWKAIRADAAERTGNSWGIEGQKRYSVIVRNHEGAPLIDAKVQLLSQEEKLLWSTRTDNSGKAELWSNPFGTASGTKAARIRIEHQGESKTVEMIRPFEDGVNVVTMQGECRNYRSIDIMLTLDATGSMGDEIEHLKAELSNIVQRIQEKRSDQKIRVGSVLYQTPDESDYITKSSPLSSNIQKTLDHIEEHPADGGGREVVAQAIDRTVRSFKEGASNDPSAKIMLLLLDEPPGNSNKIVEAYQDALERAAARGIRIVPIVASGTGFGKDRSLEQLMRSSAVISNGRYVFLTDHSGIGNSHKKPSTDSYEVTYLNDLLVDLLTDFSYTPSCDEDEFEDRKDTVEVEREFVDRVVLDSNANETAEEPDTNRVVLGNPEDPKSVDSTETSNEESNASNPDSTREQESEIAFRLFPNPTRGPLQLVVGTDRGIDRFLLKNINGSSIRKIPWEEGTERKKIDLSGLPSGIYLVTAQVGEERLTGRVILQH